MYGLSYCTNIYENINNLFACIVRRRKNKYLYMYVCIRINPYRRRKQMISFSGRGPSCVISFLIKNRKMYTKKINRPLNGVLIFRSGAIRGDFHGVLLLFFAFSSNILTRFSYVRTVPLSFDFKTPGSPSSAVSRCTENLFLVECPFLEQQGHNEIRFCYIKNS